MNATATHSPVTGLNRNALRVWSALVWDYSLRAGTETEDIDAALLGTRLGVDQATAYRALVRLDEQGVIAYVPGRRGWRPLIILIREDAPRVVSP